MKRLNSRGDTIVEVMLAILVVGSVLAGAYLSASASLNTNRASQEHSEALKQVEAQIEQVKANVAAVHGKITSYCFTSAGTVQDNPAIPPASIANDNLSSTYYNAACSRGTDNRYHISITETSSSNTYQVQARWYRSGGSDKDQQVTFYRVQQ